MSRPLEEYFKAVRSSDVHDYGFGEVEDFLLPYADPQKFDWIWTNPPFRLAQQFIATALERSSVGVAMLVRIAFLEGQDRYLKLFRHDNPTAIYQFVERVPMFKGRLERTSATATAYCWLVWEHRRLTAGHRTEFNWIPPCRKRLERQEDYS